MIPLLPNARQTLNDAATADGTIKVIDADSQNDVATQTSNMNNFYTQGVDYLVLNNINNNAITELIQQAKDKGVTLIFANSNSPTDEEFAMYDDVYHVSSMAPQSRHHHRRGAGKVLARAPGSRSQWRRQIELRHAAGHSGPL